MCQRGKARGPIGAPAQLLHLWSSLTLCLPTLCRPTAPCPACRSKNLTHPNIVQTYDYAVQLLDVSENNVLRRSPMLFIWLLR